MKKNFDISDRLAYVPEPVYDPNPGFVELYDKAWQLVADHVKSIPGMPQTPYMDEAFCATQIWIWDTCFMSLFCKYAPDAFPGVESLHNFYDVMYGDQKFPLITVPDNEPDWTGWKPGEKAPIRIHIADNPPLFAWAEYENILFTGDRQRIREILLEKQYLQKHYNWLEQLSSPWKADWLLLDTCWQKHELGYSWEGGRSGMDNSPRGRRGEKADRERPGTPDLLWLDALAQQAFSAECISRLYRMMDRAQDAEEWHRRGEEKSQLLRTLYWDDEDRMFYDRSLARNTFNKVPTIASYWPLAIGAATRDQAAAMIEKLDSDAYFGGERPFVTLARKDADFVADGGNYCRGTVWLPTAYMTLRGLTRYGALDEAHRHAEKLLTHLLNTYRKFTPHTIWESYSPGADEPAKTTDNRDFVRKDFCGWSALGPISIFIENVIGIHTVDAFERKVQWALPKGMTGKIGIRKLRFADIHTDLVAENGVCRVVSDGDYTLEINGTAYAIKAGEQHLHLA